MRSLPGNPYDGHTLPETIEQVSIAEPLNVRHQVPTIIGSEISLPRHALKGLFRAE